MDTKILDLCSLLSLDKDKILKKAIRGNKGITIYSLLYSLVYSRNISEASAYLGYSSSGPVKTCIAQYLIPLFPERKGDFGIASSTTWQYTLLELLNKKYCNGCSQILPKTYFGKNIGKTEGIRSRCRSCHVFESKEQKHYIKTRTPKWADLEKIRGIYNNCPEGFHVDHMIPLNGKIVSGLHVDNNLQYLLSKDNLIKHNKFEN